MRNWPGTERRLGYVPHLLTHGGILLAYDFTFTLLYAGCDVHVSGSCIEAMST